MQVCAAWECSAGVITTRSLDSLSSVRSDVAAAIGLPAQQIGFGKTKDVTTSKPTRESEAAPATLMEPTWIPTCRNFGIRYLPVRGYG